MPPRKAILHEQDYEVAEGSVTLTVVVGERQFGTSMVFLDDRKLANGDIRNLALGPGPRLVGRTMVVHTLVTDVRAGTDEVAVTWKLRGGTKTASPRARGTTGRNFGSQMFKAVFRFVKTGAR